MTHQDKPTEPTTSITNTAPTNFYDVLIHFIDGIFNLVRTGNIIGAVLLFIFAMLTYVAYTSPPESVDGYIKLIFDFLMGERYYLLVLSAALVVAVIIIIVQERVYKRRIHDLVEIRKALVHGISTGELKTLDKHITSGFDIRSTTTE